MNNISNLQSEFDRNKQKIEELESQIEELKYFTENSVMPMHIVNGSGIIIWSNQAELDLMGYGPEEYMGKHISNFHEDKEVIENLLAKLINRETLVNSQARLKTRSGEIKDVLINSNGYWKDGKLMHTRCLTTDITSLKREEIKRNANLESLEGLIDSMQDKMKRTEERFHKMIAEVEDYAIILLDIDGTILNWNKGAKRIKGYNAKDIIGQNFRIFYLPQDRQEQLPEKLIAEASLNGRALHEGLRVRADGTTFWGTIVITALHDDEGNIIGFTKVTRDLTERQDAKIAIDKLEKGDN